MKKLLLISIALMLSGFAFFKFPAVLAVDESGFAPDVDGVVSRFADNVYIAHDILAGKQFTGKNIILEYSDGKRVEYRAIETIIMQVYDQGDGSMVYKDGDNWYTSDDLYTVVYSRGVVFVTCYTKYGVAGWGRKFVVMEKVR